MNFRIKKTLLLIIFTILATILFFLIPNKSNINKLIIIPLIVYLLAKFLIGDFDKESTYSASDIYHFSIIILVSISTLLLLTNY